MHGSGRALPRLPGQGPTCACSPSSLGLSYLCPWLLKTLSIIRTHCLSLIRLLPLSPPGIFFTTLQLEYWGSACISSALIRLNDNGKTLRNTRLRCSTDVEVGVCERWLRQEINLANLWEYQSIWKTDSVALKFWTTCWVCVCVCILPLFLHRFNPQNDLLLSIKQLN